jgi:8-oxo-dGTP pyrophosphatase MutT (NUDIX family)
MKTVRDVSAGGVIFRRTEHGHDVVLVGRAAPLRWSLPKGTPSAGENLERAALREVREETGIQGRLVGHLLDIDYWFTMRGVRHAKTVHFYLMEAIGGDTADHDHEYDLSEWFNIAEAKRLIAYANERKVLERADVELSRTDLSAQQPA